MKVIAVRSKIDLNKWKVLRYRIIDEDVEVVGGWGRAMCHCRGFEALVMRIK